MAWLWSSSSSSSSASDGSSASQRAHKSAADYEAPDRLKRAQCWDARDEYFNCLDKHGVLDALKDADAAAQSCSKQSERFERSCASSWVKYFKQRRVAEYEKEQLLKKQEAESFGGRR